MKGVLKTREVAHVDWELQMFSETLYNPNLQNFSKVFFFFFLVIFSFPKSERVRFLPQGLGSFSLKLQVSKIKIHLSHCSSQTYYTRSMKEPRTKQ